MPSLRLRLAPWVVRRRRRVPKGSKVEKVYSALVRKGMNTGEAAAVAQKQTGQSLKTGKPPKRK